MKSLDEIQSMLVSELLENWETIIENKASLEYYNGLLGDSPFLLAGLLESILKDQFDSWSLEKWMDDSLITKINVENKKLSLWGVMIWGKRNEEEEWVEPFYFQIDLHEGSANLGNYTFLFSDRDSKEISYSYFEQNRFYWDEKYSRRGNWDPEIRNWKYIIDSKG